MILVSLENGPCAINYFKKCIEKYKKDPLIFIKTIQALLLLSNQPEWPHSYPEFDEMAKNILDDDVEDIIKYYYQCESHDKNNTNRKIEWSTDIPERFKDDLKMFVTLTSSLIYKAKYNRLKPLKLSGLATSQGDSSKAKIVRFIRADGETLDFNMEIEEIKRLIDEFDSIVSDEE